jgi:hypothetical protein
MRPTNSAAHCQLLSPLDTQQQTSSPTPDNSTTQSQASRMDTFLLPGGSETALAPREPPWLGREEHTVIVDSNTVYTVFTIKFSFFFMLHCWTS